MKKLLLITFVFMFIFTTSALAHTGLETSSPEDGEVVTEEMREIALTYEGKIEQGGTLEVSNSNGQSIPVEDISIADTQMTGTFTNALENGDYTVVWNIIGADGHPIAGEFSFTVDVPVSETAVENESEAEANSQDVNQDETPLENVEDTKTNEQSQLPSYLIPVIVIVLIAIIVGIFVGLRRKK
ncbi:copper resistance CopC family protein [Sporosarcina sp. FSL K6-5500]|uniref:copper resistance CopC family protein n=1 Tax=Sporosarcina sp. FSL K6-5500 TaxID=2921558 RepID=UPI0030F8225C